jgi:hypothetical protein
MNILSAMLANRPVTLADIQTFVDTKEPESLYLEYKRGVWASDPNRDLPENFRRYASGFANAEGGLFVVGVVGGEDVQGDAEWSIEGAHCPDSKGWTDWLNNVLRDVALRARTHWRSIETQNGGQVVVVAVDRAQELVRLHKKKHLVCFLRIGSSTVQIDDTHYADLVLGRRVKPDLELVPQDLLVSNDTLGQFIRVQCSLHNQGLVWVPDVTIALVGYFRRGAPASESIQRQLDIREGPAANQLLLSIAGDELWTQQLQPGHSPGQWLPRRHTLVSRGLPPFATIDLSVRVDQFPVCKPGIAWAWCGAILVVPMNGGPLWAQVRAQGDAVVPFTGETWIPDKGRTPVVAWLCGNDAHRDLDEILAGDPARM